MCQILYEQGGMPSALSVRMSYRDILGKISLMYVRPVPAAIICMTEYDVCMNKRTLINTNYRFKGMLLTV